MDNRKYSSVNIVINRMRTLCCMFLKKQVLSFWSLLEPDRNRLWVWDQHSLDADQDLEHAISN